MCLLPYPILGGLIGIESRNSTAPSFSSIVGRDLYPANLEKILNTYHINYREHLPQKDELIVDLGCSEGLFLEYLARQGFTHLIGVDSDPDAIEVCRERLKPYPVKHLTILHEDIKDYLSTQAENSIGYVVMNDVIEHFSKDELVLIGREVRRVLKDGGIFIAKTGNIENPLNLGLYLRDFTHQIAFTRDSLTQFCVLIGFSPNKVEVKPIRHSMNNPAEWAASIASLFLSAWLKIAARVMRMNIYETSKLIYCVAKK